MKCKCGCGREMIEVKPDPYSEFSKGGFRCPDFDKEVKGLLKGVR